MQISETHKIIQINNRINCGIRAGLTLEAQAVDENLHAPASILATLDFIVNFLVDKLLFCSFQKGTAGDKIGQTNTEPKKTMKNKTTKKKQTWK